MVKYFNINSQILTKRFVLQTKNKKKCRLNGHCCFCINRIIKYYVAGDATGKKHFIKAQVFYNVLMLLCFEKK